MTSNIAPHVEMPLMRPFKSIMFCAHDAQEHSLCYSKMGGHWRIENKNGLYLEYDNAIRAFGDLFCITGIQPGEWSVTDNPYNG